jgi:hypothetical protein
VCDRGPVLCVHALKGESGSRKEKRNKKNPGSGTSEVSKSKRKPRTEPDVGQVDGPPCEEAGGGREVNEPAAKRMCDRLATFLMTSGRKGGGGTHLKTLAELDDRFMKERREKEP